MQARFIIYCSSLFIFLSPARREECKESEAVQDALTRCGIASTSSGQRERTRIALPEVLWRSKEKAGAESQFGEGEFYYKSIS